VETKINLTTTQECLALFFKMFAGIFSIFLVLYLIFILVNAYNDFQGNPIVSDAYTTYEELYHDFISFPVITFGFMSAGWWLHYKIIKEKARANFWLAMLITTALLSQIIP